MNFKANNYVINPAQIHKGIYSIIFSGERKSDHKSIIIKLFRDEHPTPDKISRFKHEYEIAKLFEHDNNVVKVYSLEKFDNNYAIIMENINGPTLAEVLDVEKKITPIKFLKLAIAISEALGVIHQHNIIHKDINPTNIMFNIINEDNQVRIIDFGLSANLPKEHAEIVSPNVLEGTLAYLSPEQTGRMNRGIDYRTDYYSLGVTFYQMLTGELPFTNNEPMELVHHHIAIMPKAPHEIDPVIPEAISNIVMKLLAKNPEERYQNVNGLIADLNNCLIQLLTTKKIELFSLGKFDIFNRFQIPEKLYGRQAEIDILMTTYEKVMQGSAQLMLIAGYSGIGKSALVHEIHKPITEKHGYFISGKYDQFRHNIPYSAITAAFDEFIKQLLTEPKEKIAVFKNKILEAVGQNGRLIIDVIPNLACIIGEQPSVTELGPTESLNRFSYVFQKFIRILCDQEHPLVIFLDDLQCADQPSLEMIQTLLTSFEIKYLFIICAYRSNEVDSSHPVMAMIKNLDKYGINTASIHLGPLSIANVSELLVDTLHYDKNQTQPLALAKICHDKTGGNPFFLTQLLLTFYKEQLISFDSKSNAWTWDLDDITKKEISENVVDLMVSKIKELDPNTQEILQYASCIGNNFNLDLLSTLRKTKPESLLIDLQQALSVGYILAKGESYRAVNYQFAHDRIQQASHAMLDENEARSIHIDLARIMLRMTSRDSLTMVIFHIADHYNIGISDYIPEEITKDEIKKIAEINLMAAKTAKTAAAFQPAMKYIEQAMKCVNDNDWINDYPFMLELYVQAAEIAALCSMHEQVKSYANIGLKHVKNIYDEMKIIRFELLSLLAQQQHTELLARTIQTVKRLGLKLSLRPSKFQIMRMIFKIKLLLLRKNIPDLLNNPEMTDQNKKAIMDLFTIAFPAAYYIDTNLFILMSCVGVALSIQYGNTNASVYSYGTYGLVCCGALEEFEAGNQFSQLSYHLTEKLRDITYKTQVTFTQYFGINHWQGPLRDTVPKLEENFYTGLNNGDFELAGHSASMCFWHAYAAGINLNEILEKMERCIPICKNLRTLNTPLLYITQLQQMIYNLATPQCTTPWILKEPFFDESNALPNLIEKNDRAGILSVYMNRLLTSVIYEKYDIGIQAFKDYEIYMETHMATLFIPWMHFYNAINLLSRCKFGVVNEKSILKSIKKCHNKISKNAKFAQANYAHKLLLIEAEMAWRFDGNVEHAIKMYNQAIRLAKENGFVNEEALINLLAARFWLENNNEKVAQVYMQDARHCYLTWGAKAVVNYLEETYPHLFIEVSDRSFLMPHVHITTSASNQNVSELLDLKTIQKSSLIISSTIILSDLLNKLMKIVSANAGAQKSYLLLSKDDKFFIEAEGNVDNIDNRVLQSIEIRSDILPISIINYVIHSKDSIVLDKAYTSDRYANDVYIVENKPKSILCMPLLNQGVISAILYCENNLIEGAFTPHRLDVLKLLSTQIAISIDNARLYNRTQELNKQLTTLVKSYERFVPEDFLSLLAKQSINEVVLGDHVQEKMSILFCDIRNFTKRSEKLSPQENIYFINSFLKVMTPIIKKYHGFVDKYIGDAIMALYPRTADDAVKCALKMQKALHKYNLAHPDQEPIKIGIGINTGLLMLGTVGEENRMNATVISDAVNIASRVESLTKTYNSEILITEETFENLSNPARYLIDKVDTVEIKGKSKKITIYKVSSIQHDKVRGRVATGD